MKKFKTILMLTVLISLTTIGCKKRVDGCTNPTATNYNSSATDDNGTCKYSGDVTFWSNTSGSNITVDINGATGSITSYYTTNPGCGTSGCANFTLPIGTYSYTASTLLSLSTWSGTITVTTNGCAWVLLQ